MNTFARWSVFAVLLLGFILLPFFLWEAHMNAMVQDSMRSNASLALVVLAVVAFLVADVVLPIPSSFVLATTGYLLGAGLGTAVCFVGLSCAAFAGYFLGRYAGEPLARRLVGKAEVARLGHLSRQYGPWLLVALRAMPVLAEATTILAGTARLPLARFAVLVSIGNLVVAALYAGIGAWSADLASFWMVSVAAMLLPLLVMALVRWATAGAAGAAAGTVLR